MPRTISPNSIHLPLLAEFLAKLETLDTQSVEDVVIDLEDLGVPDEEAIRVSHLPSALPQKLRQQIAMLSAQHTQRGRSINAIINRLASHAEKVLDKKERADERARPRCSECKQPLPLPKRR